jgi:hypothetical protein
MQDQQRKLNPNPWQQFITDLISFVKAKQQQHHDIILCLDVNEVIGEDSVGLSKLIWDNQLSDLLDIPDLNPDEQLTDTFWHGNDRCINYMLGSQWVSECVLWCGALEYNDDIISDHGFYVDLDSAHLFGGSIKDPVAAASCGFSSKNEKKIWDYLDSLEKYIHDHRVEEHVDALIMAGCSPSILQGNQATLWSYQL